MDPDIRPQDDLFRHVNGRWLDTTDIPADRSAWGAFAILAEESEARVKAIIEELADGTHEPGSNAHAGTGGDRQGGAGSDRTDRRRPRRADRR